MADLLGPLTRQVRSEEAARKLLRRCCWPAGRPVCPRCGHRKVYALAEGRWRCAACRYTFHVLTGRFVGLAGLTARQWLGLLERFVAEQTTRGLAADLSVAYNTAYKAVTLVRLAILSASLDGRAILESRLGPELGFSGASLRPVPLDAPLAAVPVFGLLERGGMVFADFLPEVTPEDLLHYNGHFSLPLARLGSLVYSDRFRRYDTLLACGSDTLSRGLVDIPSRRPAVEARGAGFWPFLRERLGRYRGITARKFPLYLKELEFRFNHRDEDIIQLLLENICSLVPGRN
jgi:transposase